MKLELNINHVKPYLGTGLKMQYIVRGVAERTGVLTTITHNECETHPTKICIGFHNDEHIWMFKPILRPLSDLIGDDFSEGFYATLHAEDCCPDTEDQFITTIEHFGSLEMGVIQYAKLSYSTFLFLFENHFDVFGLINKGLAISYNDIK